MWQVNNEDVLLAWMTGRSMEDAEAMLGFMLTLCEDPFEGATPVPGKRLVFTRPAPVPCIVVTYVAAKQFHVVDLISIDDVTDEFNGMP